MTRYLFFILIFVMLLPIVSSAGPVYLDPIDGKLKSLPEMAGLNDEDVISEDEVDDTPVDGVTKEPVSSNWAYDHANGTDPHPLYLLESSINTVDKLEALANAGTYFSVLAMASGKADLATRAGVGTSDSPEFAGLTVGSPNTTEGTEVAVVEHQIENDASETLTAYARTVELSDETDGTEDAVVREYLLVDGTLGLWRSSKVYAAAPTGSEAPVMGAIVWCDGTTWDPTDTTDGIKQQVWYDGDSWEKIGDPAD